MQSSVICTRFTSVCGSQNSPVVLCMQNSAPSFTITSLCVPAFICRFWMQNSDFWTRTTSLYGPRYHLSFCACKTALLAQELQVSMCPSPHLRFLHENQRLLDQNYRSLWVPHLTCRLVHPKQRD